MAELQKQFLLAEQSLKALAADQRMLIADARRQVKGEFRRHTVDHLATHVQQRRTKTLRAAAFGSWSGAVKGHLETALVEAIQMLQVCMCICVNGSVRAEEI